MNDVMSLALLRVIYMLLTNRDYLALPIISNIVLSAEHGDIDIEMTDGKGYRVKVTRVN